MLQFGTLHDPIETLAALDAVDGEVTDLGSKDIRGEPTHGYAFEISADKVRRLGEDKADEMAEVVVAMEAWTNADGRVRRLSTTIDQATLQAIVHPGGDTYHGEQTKVIEFFDFGTPVTIEVPQQDEILDRDTFRGDLTDDL